MNVRKFVAANARDALQKVKEILGADSIILSNRTIAGGVEIMAVAAKDVGGGESLPVQEKPLASPVSEDDYTVSLSHAKRKVSPARTEPVAPFSPRPAPKLEPSFPPVEAVNKAEVIPLEVIEEIRHLRKIVEQQLAGFAWGESARAEPVKTELLRQMLDAGFSPQLSRELLVGLPRELSRERGLAWVKSGADRLLKTSHTESDMIDQGGVYALVGPTGVGKTTTIAKLAARAVLRYGANKIALINTDGYRIGAYEQLRIYGRILGVSVYLVKNAEELQQTLEDLKHKHMVLIDTMGMSQRDRMVGEQSAMFSRVHVKRVLLLPATGRGDTLDDVIGAYGGSALSGCILSKVDEAASLAPALDALIRHQLCLHYVTNGQRVPEDIHLPNRIYLLHRAFKEIPETSAHRLDGLEPGLMMANSSGGRVLNGTYRG